MSIWVLQDLQRVCVTVRKSSWYERDLEDTEQGFPTT
jgi:hypothetical protein